jgi:hypothetical protein
MPTEGAGQAGHGNGIGQAGHGSGVGQAGHGSGVGQARHGSGTRGGVKTNRNKTIMQQHQQRSIWIRSSTL